MKIFVATLLLVISQAYGANKTAPKQKPFFMEVTEKWEIHATDDQVFSLHAENTSLGPMQSVSFLNGNRELKNLPAFKEPWMKWRTQLTQMAERFPANVDCPHPIKFENVKTSGKAKSKSVCLNNLTQTERDSVQKLTQELSDFLYGK